MAFADEVADAAVKACQLKMGAFYGPTAGIPPGAGLIYPNVTYPIFNSDLSRFQARTGPVLVLTHECDVDPANARAFNTELLVAPLMSIEAFAAEFDRDDDQRRYGRELASNIASARVPRLCYMPPHLAPLERGAFIHFNGITSSHMTLLGAAQPLCALSEYGLEIIDLRLKNHLFRPKDDQLPRLA
jgi:hypothetical protein